MPPIHVSLTPQNHHHHPPPPMAATAAAAYGTDHAEQPLHFVLLPLKSAGHTLPLFHTASLLLSRHPVTTQATLLLAGADTPPFLPSPPPNLHLLLLPHSLEGHPTFADFYLSLRSLRSLLEPHLFSLRARGHRLCLVSDFANTWSRALAADLGALFLLFYGIPCFSLLSFRLLRVLPAADPDWPVCLPGLPLRVEVSHAQAPGFFSLPGMDGLRDELEEAERTCDGVVVNTFDGLEGWYVEEYARAVGKRVWTVGPVFLAGEDRGGEGEGPWRRWLDARGAAEVMYVALGSIVEMGLRQAAEVGAALEGIGGVFLWVVRPRASEKEEVSRWVAEFQARVGDRGLVLTTWVPQVKILSHPAIGAFMTHGGWNSTFEGLCAGLPMVVWPHFAEQFLNEKLVVDVLNVGVGMGVTEPFRFGKNEKAFVGREAIEKALRTIMDKGEEGEGRRRRAKEIAVMAKEAMSEGGSSNRNLAELVNFVRSKVDGEE